MVLKQEDSIRNAVQDSFGWSALAPYWHHLEDTCLDRQTVLHLIPHLHAPVLVVGAGMGLLVETLRQQGKTADGVELDPAMIARARSIRGLELHHADARKMPFKNGHFGSAIIATGVIDFIDDLRVIAAILEETRRVTSAQGPIIAAFHRHHPQFERYLRRLGLFEPDGRYQYRRMCELGKLSVDGMGKSLGAIAMLARTTRFRAALLWIGVLLRLPGRLRKNLERTLGIWTEAKRNGADLQVLLQSMPSLVPYRKEPEILKLIRSIGCTPGKLQTFDTCFTIEILAHTKATATSND